INELEFNRSIASAIRPHDLQVTCPLRERQFHRATARGALALLRDDVKRAIFRAYDEIGAANQEHRRVAADLQRSGVRTGPANNASRNALPLIEAALAALMRHMVEDPTEPEAEPPAV